MLLKSDQLPKHIEGELASLYCFFGAETLLIEEAMDSFRQTARAQGFGERVLFYYERGFDMTQLAQNERSASLFADKKLIELRMTVKPEAADAEQLIDYAKNMRRGDAVLLIAFYGALNATARKVKWFQAIEQHGVAVEFAGLDARQLPNWIGARMRAKGLAFDADVPARLTHFVEGNLLACAQAIDLLALLSPDKPINASTIDYAIADHARFTVFTFVDACVAGNIARCVRTLQGLRRNQVEPILVLVMLTREIRLLCQLSAGMASGRNAHALLKQHGVWANRQSLIKAALARLSRAHCEHLLHLAAQTDLMAKGRAPIRRGDLWLEIEHLGLRVCAAANR